MPSDCPVFTVVTPMKNEAGNARTLIAEIVKACEPVGTFEIIAINDGSTDETGTVLKTLQNEYPVLKIITHDQSGGQSAAVHNGVLCASGLLVATLDGDGQNPPDQIPALLKPLLDEKADPKLGLVAGQRVGRQDTWSRKLASGFANKLRGALLKDGTRDTGCGLKAFRRDAFLNLPYFNHMHRYLPALFSRDGWTVAHVDVTHRERGAGKSNYTNFGRALVGIYDLIGVAWLIRRRKIAAARSPELVSVSEIKTTEES